MRGKLVLFVFALFLMLSTGARALISEPPLANPLQETEAQQLFHALRCVVCAGESLAESNAALAVQMRAEIRRRIGAGESTASVLSYFQTRYGDAILMRPPVAPRTIPLWLAPLGFLIVGMLLILRRWR
ncbi:MAG: cytochrome c-type biogenesis protein CcmH [Alphaproteobacteria bacterium]